MRSAPTVFDKVHYLRLIEARGDVIRRVVSGLKEGLEFETALDAGCGVGFFTKIIQECGLQVRGFDGREENIREARLRHSDILFEAGDIEDSSILRLGRFDLVLCFGLLYHLENPLHAIRNLRSLTAKALLLESMCFPSADAFAVLREEPSSADQSLTDLAFYPSEGCIVKMLYRVGFANVLRVRPLPDHEDFRETREHQRRRTILLAVRQSFYSNDFDLLPEPADVADPWQKVPENSRKLEHRIRRFLAKPFGQKIGNVANKIRRRRGEGNIVLRLPFGAKWLLRRDQLSDQIAKEVFENREYAFVDRFLRPGMTVLDIGAHHGFYSLLASRRVGPEGRVIAFEPSDRERQALKEHLEMNECRNVVIERVALGNEEKDADLFVAQDRFGACNSLRPPIVMGGTSRLRVRLIRLDKWLVEHEIDCVDFIKLDVEGGELDVLRGAENLLQRTPRPFLLTEVQDIRTEPWGYESRQIVEHMTSRGFKWFGIASDGSLEILDVGLRKFHGNFVACPEEREPELRQLTTPDEIDANRHTRNTNVE